MKEENFTLWACHESFGWEGNTLEGWFIGVWLQSTGLEIWPLQLQNFKNCLTTTLLFLVGKSQYETRFEPGTNPITLLWQKASTLQAFYWFVGAWSFCRSLLVSLLAQLKKPLLSHYTTGLKPGLYWLLPNPTFSVYAVDKYKEHAIRLVRDE